jgi:hypothetical protein
MDIIARRSGSLSDRIWNTAVMILSTKVVLQWSMSRTTRHMYKLPIDTSHSDIFETMRCEGV